MRTFHPRQRTIGVTLIEILLAVVVLVFGILGVANIIDANQRNTHRATENLQALELARMKVAEFRAAGGQALANKATGGEPVHIAGELEGDTDFSWQATLTRDEAAGHIVYQVTVYVVTFDVPESRAELTGFLNY